MSVARILYNDARQVVINKPAGVAMQSFGSAGNAWRQLLQDVEEESNAGQPLKVVHRLDSGTSGALILAKTLSAARALSVQFERGQILKRYHAIVDNGNGGWKKGTDGELQCFLQITDTGVSLKHSARPGEKNLQEARTSWCHLHAADRYSLLELLPHTGRKHQLRIQCAQMLGAPVAGDFKYGYSGRPVLGHLLHCSEVQFQTWQKTGKATNVSINAPFSEEMLQFARKCGLQMPA